MASEKRASSPASRSARSPEKASLSAVVVGAHPAAWLCALLLHEARLPVGIAEAGLTVPDRLIALNPAFFNLHPALKSLRGKLPAAEVAHVRFLGPEGADATSDDRADKLGPLTLVTPLPALREQVRQLALDARVRQCEGAKAQPHVRVSEDVLNRSFDEWSVFEFVHRFGRSG